MTPEKFYQEILRAIEEQDKGASATTYQFVLPNLHVIYGLLVKYDHLCMGRISLEEEQQLQDIIDTRIKRPHVPTEVNDV